MRVRLSLAVYSEEETALRRALIATLAALGAVIPAVAAHAETTLPPPARAVVLPGPEYEVLRAGPVDGPHPTRADTVAIRYVGRLPNGEVFSTSADNGTGTTNFSVREVIPGVSALLQLMRPGDRWRMTLPSYLAYGMRGRPFGPHESTLKRSVPPDSTLVFDMELVSTVPAP